MSIDNSIKKMNTANILLDAFGDGHEFTMYDYEELTKTINELFGGRYSEDNPCYSACWLRDHYPAFGIEKVGSRELEIVDSRYVYGTGYRGEVRKVKQFIYRMTNAQGCSNVTNHCKEEMRCEIDRVTARIERNKLYLETLKKML